MQLTTPRIQAALAGASWIRRMFEQGRELKQRVGTENVFDFSLGNPDLPPPPEAATQILVMNLHPLWAMCPMPACRSCGTASPNDWPPSSSARSQPNR